MNLARGPCRVLSTSGHECHHVGDMGMASASDTEIEHFKRLKENAPAISLTAQVEKKTCHTVIHNSRCNPGFP